MILRTLLSHYRRHPVQGLFLLAGIVMANALLVGTQLINAQARASYAQGEQVLGAGPAGQVTARDNEALFDERHYVALRRTGFNEVAPLLRRVVTTAEGEPLELLGIDGLALPRPDAADGARGGGDPVAGSGQGFGGFTFPPYELWGAELRLRQLGWAAGDRPLLADGRRLPGVVPVSGDEFGHRLLLDIGALQALTDTAGQLSALLVFTDNPERLRALQAALPPGLAYRDGEQGPDPSQLTRSFHLNLAAMGLLAFVVGLFLIYNALAFSYTDRLELLRKLRLAGVARRPLAAALLLELMLFLVVGGAIGFWIGSQLAALLLPGVGQTLAQLYGVYIRYPDALVPAGFWMPVLMTIIAAAACALFPLRQALHTPLLGRWSGGWALAAARQRDRWLLAGGIALLVAAAGLARVASGTWIALAGMACLLLGAALCLPAVLRALLRLMGRAVPPASARLGWLLADSRWLLGPASLALMAMTLALVANSGLNSMISSFRDATDRWLEQRLAAQLYLRADVNTEALGAWLGQNAPEAGFVLRHEVELDRAPPGGPVTRVTVIDLADAGPFRTSVDLMRGEPDAERRFFDGQGVFVSERAWRLDGWDLGDRVHLCGNSEPVPVLGVYHDYGNPRAQWMVSRARFEACWPGTPPDGIGIYGPPSLDWNRLRAELASAFELREGALIDQDELRAVGLAVFDRTFAVTHALNLLTLVVAGIGIFCAVSAIHHHRVGQQALLASLGLSRAERGGLLLAQWGLLGLLCMVLVWPLGTALAAYLAGVVTPAAFGWSFPLRPEWGHYAVLAALASGCLVLAVALPSARLLRISPAAMLREQTL